MRSRIYFLTVVAFWLVMNALLLRSQWGAHSRIGSAVPPEVVWEKILSAPDTSSLDIYEHSNKVGICHWVANVGNSPFASTAGLMNKRSSPSADCKYTQVPISREDLSGLRFDAVIRVVDSSQPEQLIPFDSFKTRGFQCASHQSLLTVFG